MSGHDFTSCRKTHCEDYETCVRARLQSCRKRFYLTLGFSPCCPSRAAQKVTVAVTHAAKPKPSPKAAKQPEARPKSAPPPRPAAAARTPIFLGGPVKGGGQPL